MFTKVLVVAIALVGAQAIEHAYHHLEEEQYEPAHYSFEYSVNDEHTGDIKSHSEQREGDVTQGEYSLVEPDGSTRTVRYTVDKHSGFNAEVHREPSTHPAAPSHHSGHHGSFAVHHAPLAVHHAPLAVHHAAVHHAPLAVHHAAVHHAPLAVHHAPLAVHHAPLAVAHHAIPLHHGNNGHASSSSSFSTHGAHIASSTYHHAPALKKFY